MSLVGAEHLAGVENSCALYNLEPLEVGGGGNCLFHAIAYYQYEDPSQHKRVRREIVKELRDNKALYVEKNLVEGDFDAYVKRMSTLGTWGGQTELQAAANLYRRSFYVVADDHLVSTYPFPECLEGSPIDEDAVLAYPGGVHYQATVKTSADGINESVIPSLNPVAAKKMAPKKKKKKKKKEKKKEKKEKSPAKEKPKKKPPAEKATCEMEACKVHPRSGTFCSKHKGATEKAAEKEAKKAEKEAKTRKAIKKTEKKRAEKATCQREHCKVRPRSGAFCSRHKGAIEEQKQESHALTWWDQWWSTLP
jgi:hypothetical protein